jgi:hypothetical protein
MADDTELNLGSGGDVIAADDIGPGVKYQRVKMTLGADGVNDGDVSGTNPMPVEITDGTDTALVSAAGNLAVEIVAPTGLALAANQLVDGHNVTVDNGAGASAVNIQDGGNIITVDGTVSVTGVATAANQLPDGHNVTVDNASIAVTAASALEVAGDEAHDAAATANPVRIGHKAIQHGANPAEVAAGDVTDQYANRAGVPFVMGGHPNVITEVVKVTDADGALSNQAIFVTTEKIVVTRVSITADNANTADVRVLVGLAATTLATPTTTGAAGLLVEHPGVPAGGGITVGDGSGILGVGATGDDLRYTCEDPVGGSICISVSFYEIAG